MKSFFLIFFFFVFLNTVNAKNIIFGTSGIAKVGKACFASIVIKDETDLNIQELQLNIFSTDENQKLVGRSNIIFERLNKNQPYVTSVPVELENKEDCQAIKNVKIHVKSCITDKKVNQKCKSFLKIKKNLKNSFVVNTTIIEDSSFFNTDHTKLYLKEFGIFLKKLNSDYARRYKIKNNTRGLLVVGVNNSSTFIEGDLITEVEMTKITNISQLKKQLTKIFDNKKQHILINFIRDNNEKLVAVKLN
ncbi:MAG: hypothetical protein CMJ06_01635 [Pelagibacterales bacterium]|nr:hypothetical protein [Pelagibacterales bacterium]OUU63360.1 MAG: hypothetical protein CBC22_01605 [Alphaproteobacteria bacterium TMED62]|tara:strand:+ start:2254 stop:2997 length:744 start_codon:yes stop_codon:yes gene_type:complete